MRKASASAQVMACPSSGLRTSRSASVKVPVCRELKIPHPPTSRSGGLLPVAQYVRMSTDQQQYLIDNQREGIANCPFLHSMEIVKTYSDAARSGLCKTGLASNSDSQMSRAVRQVTLTGLRGSTESGGFGSGASRRNCDRRALVIKFVGPQRSSLRFPFLLRQLDD
jgi:hypothetical protein